MKAICIKEFGKPDVLVLSEVAKPTVAKGEALVRVHATAVNRADLLQRAGLYPAPPDAPPDIPGLEFAGVVEEVGPGVSEVKAGDRVFGLAGGGTYAEYLVVPARTLAHIPQHMSFVDAASIPEAYITAYDAMVSQAQLAAGETVLVHAVGSGVGVAAVQIAKAIGARSIGTARTADKLDAAAAQGMTHGIETTDALFAERVNSLTNGRGFDVCLEVVGAKYFPEDVKCAATKARIMIVGLVSGARCEADLALILRKRLTIKGTTLRMRPLEEKIIASQLLQRHLVPMFEDGRLTPVVDKVFPLEQAAQAHQFVEDNKNFGKVVISIAE